jgi:hypothetical protein
MVERTNENASRGTNRPLLYKIYDPQNTGMKVVTVGFENEEPVNKTVQEVFRLNEWVAGACFLKAQTKKLPKDLNEAY